MHTPFAELSDQVGTHEPAPRRPSTLHRAVAGAGDGRWETTMITASERLGTHRPPARRHPGFGLLALVIMVCVGLSGCAKERADSSAAPPARLSASTPVVGADVDGLVEVGGGRRIFARCTGTGSPTLMLEGGDEDTSSSYGFAESRISSLTRTCVYDRANLGSSDSAGARVGWPTWSPTSRGCWMPPTSPAPTSWSEPPAAGTSRPATRSNIAAGSPASCSSKCPRRSETRRPPSSRKRAGTHRSTSRTATTSRSRRTPGAPDGSSATSP